MTLHRDPANEHNRTSKHFKGQTDLSNEKDVKLGCSKYKRDAKHPPHGN